MATHRGNAFEVFIATDTASLYQEIFYLKTRYLLGRLNRLCLFGIVQVDHFFFTVNYRGCVVGFHKTDCRPRWQLDL